MFDLSNNGLRFSSPQDGYVFDIRANGKPVRVSWPLSENTYWLALDRNGNGAIDNGAELFGNVTPLQGGGTAAHGYIPLGEFDDNDDGRIDRQDKIYTRLVLWRHPLPVASVAKPDEYRTLADASAARLQRRQLAHTAGWRAEQHIGQ